MRNSVVTALDQQIVTALAVAIALVGAWAAVAGAQPASAAQTATEQTKASAPIKPTAKPKSSVLTFEVMDRNADGKLSEEEFRNAAAFVFAGHDANKDGRVTRAEAQKVGPGALKTLEQVDAQKSGAIELPLFLDFCLGVFRAADADGDGSVSVAERDVFRAQVKAERDKAPK